MNTKTKEHDKCRNTKRKIRATVKHKRIKCTSYIFLVTLYFEETFY